MNEEAAFLQAMLENPHDSILRLVFADWLEERGDPRGELLRLTHILTQQVDFPERAQTESRLFAILDEGVRAVGPTWTNKVGIEFTWVPAGTFRMGSPLDDRSRFDDETPHQVTLTQGFFLGVYPVTQAQYQAVMSRNPSKFRGDDHLPVDSVDWKSCNQFCKSLRKREKRSYRLPTEAEWEYACRAGSSAPFCFGDDRRKLLEFAWYEENAAKQTHPVGQMKPNGWGLYDMHGNVWEWCQDRSGPYPTGHVTDPEGKGTKDLVVRGGSWLNMSSFVRCAHRRRIDEGWLSTFQRGGNHNVGFRVCCGAD